MIELDSRTVGGLFVLQFMAQHDGPTTLDEIARAGRLPKQSLKGLLAKLRRAGWVAFVRGKGYVQTRAPGQITVNAVFRLLGNRRAPAGGCRLRYWTCPYRGSCSVAPLCRESFESNRRLLRTFTLADFGPQPPEVPDCLGWRERAASEPKGTPRRARRRRKMASG